MPKSPTRAAKPASAKPAKSAPRSKAKPASKSAKPKPTTKSAAKATRATKPARSPVRAKVTKPAPKSPTRRPKPRATDSVSKRTDDPKTRKRALAVAQAGLSKKAFDVLLIDVRGLTSIADYFVVMSGSAGPQLRAIADSVEGDLRKQGVMPISIEGYSSGNWLLIDFGDVVAHVFEPEMRGYYDLEGLWADAPRERIEG